MSFSKIQHCSKVIRKRSLKRKMGKTRSALVGTDNLIYVSTESKELKSGVVDALYVREDRLPRAWAFPLPDKGIVDTPVLWQSKNSLLLATDTKGNSSHLFCLDATTGTERWRYPHSDDPQIVERISTPIVTQHGVVALIKLRGVTAHEQLFFFDTQGEKKKINLNHHLLSKPYNLTADAEAVYIAVKIGISKYALSSGQHINTFFIKDNHTASNSQIIIVGESLFFCIDDDAGENSSVVAYNRNSGALLWSRPVGRAITTGLFTWEDSIFVGVKSDIDGEYKILALAMEDGHKKWKHPFVLGSASHFHAPITVHDNTILAGSDDGNVYALDCETGILRWWHSMPKAIYCQPFCMPEDQTIYIADRNAYIVELQIRYSSVVIPNFLTKIDTDTLVKLRDTLVHFFGNESELKNVYFEMGIGYDTLVGSTVGTSQKSQELIKHLERHGRLNELVELIQRSRPRFDMKNLLGEHNGYRQ